MAVHLHTAAESVLQIWGKKSSKKKEFKLRGYKGLLSCGSAGKQLSVDEPQVSSQYKTVTVHRRCLIM